MLPHNHNDPVRLFYAKDFTDEWVLLIADTDHFVRGILRTAGWSALCDHPISQDGLNDKEWRWAEWTGRYNTESQTFTGTWEEGFMRIMAAAGGPPVSFPDKFTAETIADWADSCREKYETKYGGYLLRSAFRLWLITAGHTIVYAKWVVAQIHEEPKRDLAEN